MRKRYYLGLVKGQVKHELFTSATEPTSDSHGARYLAVIGPFDTKRGAVYMQSTGPCNPHCQTVSEAERLARLTA